MVEKFSFRFGQLTISKFLHFAVFPMLTGFMLDLPWTTQALVSFAFACASLFVGDFVEALLALWQAAAVAALINLLGTLFFAFETSSLFAALSILIVWVPILFCKNRRVGHSQIAFDSYFSSEVITTLCLFASFLMVPRGFEENFGFLAGEDNEAWLRTVIDINNSKILNLESGFDSQSIQYLVKFVLNAVLQLNLNFESLDENSSLTALRVVTNSWIIILVTSIVFGQRILSTFIFKVQHRNPNYLIPGIVGIQTVLYFRSSQIVGHFSQYLLNCIVAVLVLTFIAFETEKKALFKILLLLTSLAISIGIVGSYNPWLPISISAILILVTTGSNKSLIRSLYRSRFFKFYLLIGFFSSPIVYKLAENRASGLDDGGAVTVIPQEGVLVVIGISLLAIANLFKSHLSKNSNINNEYSIISDRASRKYLAVTLLALILGALFRMNFNNSVALSFTCLVGLVFNGNAISEIRNNFELFTKSAKFDCLFLLAFASFMYAMIIYLMSRFIGPVFEPRYAAHKAMFIVFGQFSWLVLLAMCLNMFSFSINLHRINSILISFCFFTISGLSQFYTNHTLKTEWWHRTAIESIRRDPDAIIVCMNEEWRVPDYSVYTCNRFMQSLTKFPYPAAGFRYLAWYQPDEFEKISKWFNSSQKSSSNFSPNTEIIVLSQSELSNDSKKIFDSVNPKMIHFKYHA